MLQDSIPILIFAFSLTGLVKCVDPHRECVVRYPIEIKFDQWLENVLQSGSYPDFTGDTTFNNAPIPTRIDLFAWNTCGVRKAKIALEKHFNRQRERGQPQYKIFHIGPIISYNGLDRGEIKLENVWSNEFSNFKNPEFVVRARKQTSVAEELTCDENIMERNDLIYYLTIGFSYDSITLISDFGIDHSPTDGILAITLTDFWVKIFLQIKEIDNSANFRCTTEDGIFPTGYTHRAPELTVKYGLTNVEIAVERYPTNTVREDVDELLNHLKTEIMSDDEAMERRIWAYFLPNLTKYVMRMKSVKNIGEILYYVVQNSPNTPRFSFMNQASSSQRSDDFLAFS